MFKTQRLPLKILTLDANDIDFVQRLNIDESFMLEQFDKDKVLVSIRTDSDLSLIKNETKKFSILFCHGTECTKLIDFELNL